MEKLKNYLKFWVARIETRLLELICFKNIDIFYLFFIFQIYLLPKVSFDYT